MKLDFQSKAFFLIVAAILGVVLLGTGITGNVISKNCCFGDGCSPEDRCFLPPGQAGDDYALSFTGLALILVSGALFLAERKR